MDYDFKIDEELILNPCTKYAIKVVFRGIYNDKAMVYNPISGMQFAVEPSNLVRRF